MQTHTWQVYRAYPNGLENTRSPRQTWWWTSVSAGFRWPSTSPAASPACDLGCCSIPCHKCPLPCRSQPPSPWKFHPTWKRKSSEEREHLPVSVCSNTSLNHAEWRCVVPECDHVISSFLDSFWLAVFHTHMQLRAARSLWTNFSWAKYSIPLATWSPKPIRSFTVGFCGGHKKFWTELTHPKPDKTTEKLLSNTPEPAGPESLTEPSYPFLWADEVSHIPVLHVR